MTYQEFQQWLEHHKQLHPDFVRWIDYQGDESRRKIGAAFFRAMEHVQFAAACAVSEGLVDGRYEQPEQWAKGRGWNTTGAYVAKLAMAITRAHNRPTMLDSRKPDSWKCVKCRDSGLLEVFSTSAMERVAKNPELRKLLATLKDYEPEPPPRIEIPNDDRPETSISRIMDEVLAGQAVSGRANLPPAVREARRLRTMNVICDCAAGEKVWRERGGESPEHQRAWSDTQRYDERRFCECPGGDVVRNAAEFADWVDWKLSPVSRENYTNAFDEFNEAPF